MLDEYLFPFPPKESPIYKRLTSKWRKKGARSLQNDLIIGARNGDRTAFAALLAEHYDFIHAVAWRWSGNADDADDITQDVCLRLGQTIRNFRGESRFRTWLYTLTLNAVRDKARREARELAKTTAYFVDPTMRSSPDGEEDLARLWENVRALPARQCDAVMLVYAEGLSHAEAADVMGCSESTVSWHVHEARRRLRDLLGQDVA